MPLVPAFYTRPTLDVLGDLIGEVLVHDTADGRTSGAIVEAEAYIGEDDPACHAAPGPTPRNAPLYGDPGRAYVYLNYGLHNMVNVVTQPAGEPAAILIRALAPIDGIEIMRARRHAARQRTKSGAVADDVDLCRGPGNLTVSLGITLAQNRAPLTSGTLFIEDCHIEPEGLVWSPRIGIRVGTEHLWRCAWRHHASVSVDRGRDRARQAIARGAAAATAVPRGSRRAR